MFRISDRHIKPTFSLLIALIMALLPCITIPAPALETKEVSLKEANKLLTDGNYKEALSAYKKLADKDGSECARLGLLYARIELLPDELTEINSTIRESMSDEKFKREIVPAVAYLCIRITKFVDSQETRKKHLTSASTFSRAALEHNSGLEQPHFVLAVAEMEQGRSDEARDHLGEAITKAKRKYLNWECAWEDDKRIDSFQHEALSALMNKDYDGAKEHFQSILKLLNASDVFYPGINEVIHKPPFQKEQAKLQDRSNQLGWNPAARCFSKFTDRRRRADKTAHHSLYSHCNNGT